MGKVEGESTAGNAGSSSIELVFKNFDGDALFDMKVNSAWTVGQVAKTLAARVKLPAKKMYQLFLGVELLAAGDALRTHVAGESAEFIACEDSDDSSDESSQEQGKKRKESGKEKADKKKKSKSKKKDKKKDKKKASSKKKKGKSSSSSSDAAPKKKKHKKDERQDLEDDKDDDPTLKSAWIAERLDELRKMRPPLPLELCLVRAQKDWTAHKETEAEEQAEQVREDREKNWPPVVHEAMREAEEEARAAGKSEEDVQVEIAKAAGFALKVAKDNGLYVPPEDSEDPSKVPLFFQKRVGLQKAINYVKSYDKEEELEKGKRMAEHARRS